MTDNNFWGPFWSRYFRSKSIWCQKKLGPQKLRPPKNWVQKVKSGRNSWNIPDLDICRQLSRKLSKIELAKKLSKKSSKKFKQRVKEKVKQKKLTKKVKQKRVKEKS